MRSKFLMIASLVVLGVGLIGILYLKASKLTNVSSSAATQTEVPTPESLITIWTSKQPIESGDRINRENVRVEKIPESEAFEMGISEDVSLEFVDGMVVKKALVEGSLVLPENIALPTDAGYFNLVIEPGYTPVPISVPTSSAVGGVIEAGSFVDVLVLTSSTQNLSGRPAIRDLDSVSLIPLFMGVKVLQVQNKDSGNAVDRVVSETANPSPEQAEVSLVLQLTRKQLAKLTIARNIAQVEVHLSSGEKLESEISADSGDILSDYKSVRELRARNEVIE